jgi:hypothetical protein
VPGIGTKPMRDKSDVDKVMETFYRMHSKSKERLNSSRPKNTNFGHGLFLTKASWMVND